MEEILEHLLEKKMEKMRDIKKNFKSAEELGLRFGDMIIFKDGEVLYVTDLEDEGFRYKNIAEVKRPVKWEEVEIKLSKRTRKNKKESK